MRFVRAAGLVLAAVLSSGCLVMFLQPAFDEHSIVTEPALAGRWASAEDALSVVVEPGEWRSYGLSVTDRSGTTKYTGFLTRIGKALFLVIRPVDGVERQNYLLATHGVLKIDLTGDRMDAAPLDYDAALKRVRSGALGIPAGLDVKQNIVVTAGTARLRTWLAAHAASPGWWGEAMTFVKAPISVRP